MAAYVVMVIAFLLNSRSHIKDILKRTFLESAASTTIDDSGEVLPYRWAVLGTVLSFFLLVGLCVYAGMSFWIACSIIVLFLIASTALSWMVVNGRNVANPGTDVSCRILRDYCWLKGR